MFIQDILSDIDLQIQLIYYPYQFFTCKKSFWSRKDAIKRIKQLVEQQFNRQRDL